MQFAGLIVSGVGVAIGATGGLVALRHRHAGLHVAATGAAVLLMGLVIAFAVKL